MINVGVIFVYFLIIKKLFEFKYISQNLYPVLAYLLNLMGLEIDASNNEPVFTRFSMLYCGILISVLIFPLLIMKQINFLLKLSSKGVYCVSVLILYVLAMGVYSLINTKFDFQYKLNNETSINEAFTNYRGKSFYSCWFFKFWLL